MKHASYLRAMAGAVTPEERNRLAPGTTIDGRDATWLDRMIATHDAALTIRVEGDDALRTTEVLSVIARALDGRAGSVSLLCRGGVLDHALLNATPDRALAGFLVRNGYANVQISRERLGVDVVAVHDGVTATQGRDELLRTMAPNSRRARRRRTS